MASSAVFLTPMSCHNAKITNVSEAGDAIYARIAVVSVHGPARPLGRTVTRQAKHKHNSANIFFRQFRPLQACFWVTRTLSGDICIIEKRERACVSENYEKSRCSVSRCCCCLTKAASYERTNIRRTMMSLIASHPRSRKRIKKKADLQDNFVRFQTRTCNKKP